MYWRYYSYDAPVGVEGILLGEVDTSFYMATGDTTQVDYELDALDGSVGGGSIIEIDGALSSLDGRWAPRPDLMKYDSESKAWTQIYEI